MPKGKNKEFFLCVGNKKQSPAGCEPRRGESDFLSVLVLFLDLFDYLVGDRFAVADDEDAEG